MLRNYRRCIAALVLILLAGAVPAAAAPLEEPWRGIWDWLMSLRGLELDPDGLTGEGDRGPGADPDGLTGEGDRGLEADPNG